MRKPSKEELAMRKEWRDEYNRQRGSTWFTRLVRGLVLTILFVAWASSVAYADHGDDGDALCGVGDLPGIVDITQTGKFDRKFKVEWIRPDLHDITITVNHKRGQSIEYITRSPSRFQVPGRPLEVRWCLDLKG